MLRSLSLALVVVCFVEHSFARPQQPSRSADDQGTSPAQATAARPAADYSKEPILIQHRRTMYVFENDGTGKRTDEMSLRVQNEAGVRQFGQLLVGYDSVDQTAEVIHVRVLKPDGSTVTADPSAIQDMTAPVARAAPVYTDYHEKHITVPGLRPGDVLEYKTVITTKAPLAPNQFWMEHTFDDNIIILDEQLTIDVPKSRELKLKTRPEFSKYEKQDTSDRRVYTWTWQNLTTRAAREKAEEEDQPAKKHQRSKDEAASVQLTTFRSWDELGKWYAGLERDRRKPSDELSAKARELTRGLSSDREKIQAVYDYVAKNYRYVSLSFGLGRYQPHAAADVFKNDYGDCKDKQTLLAAMLDALGYHANSILIHTRHKLDEDVPSPLQFNHVIGNIQQGRELLWMDTTTEVAPVGMLLLALRNREALQIRPGGSTSLVTTPSALPFDALNREELEGHVTDFGKLEGHSTVVLRGDAEVLLRGALRHISENKWNDVFNSSLSHRGMHGGKVTNIKVADLNDVSKPLVLEFDVNVPNFLDWTAKDTKIHLPLGAFTVPSLDEDDSEPAKLGGPSTYVVRMKLSLPETLLVTPPAPVSIKRDYAEYTANYRFAEHVLSAERKLVINTAELDPARASDLRSFARVLNIDSQQQGRIENTAAATGTVPREAQTKELEDAAYNALNARKYKESAALYERIAEKDPKHKRAWNNLGRAYMGLKQYDKAVVAYKKATELNPYDAWAWNNLGIAYMEQQHYEDAIVAYRKQIEINPLDKFAHANLGRLLLKLHRNSEAAPELERAAEITPDNTGVKVSLGTAYLRLGQTDKAMDVFEKALQKSSNSGTWNGVAYSLADNKQHLDKALKYAESAVSTTETQLRNLPPEKAEQSGLPLSASLADYWDTLGWVYFQQGDIDKAEKYIAPAWKHSEFGEIGYHLGKIYEKRGEQQKAIDAYAAAAAATSHIIPDSRARLDELVGAKPAEKLVSGKVAARAKQRTLELGWAAPDETAEVLFSFAGSGDVSSAKFLTAGKGLTAHEPELARLKLNLPFPDTTTEAFVHKGLISCDHAGNCKLVWLPAGANDVAAADVAEVSEPR